MEKGFESIVGMPVPQAEAALLVMGYQMNVVKKDGEVIPMTAQYSPERVNVVVERGIVVKLASLG